VQSKLSFFLILFYLRKRIKILKSFKTVFDNAAGSCAQGGITDKLVLFCGSGSFCNNIPINFVTQLPDALVMTRPTSARNALSVGDSSFDPEVEFANLTKTVIRKFN
jgi:hypothetical protein